MGFAIERLRRRQGNGRVTSSSRFEGGDYYALNSRLSPQIRHSCGKALVRAVQAKVPSCQSQTSKFARDLVRRRENSTPDRYSGARCKGCTTKSGNEYIAAPGKSGCITGGYKAEGRAPIHCRSRKQAHAEAASQA